MTTHTPQRIATLTGTFWLLTILAGFVTLAVKGMAATAANTFAALTYLGATLCAAQLVKPVSRNLATATAILGTVGVVLSLENMFVNALPLPGNIPFLFYGTQCFLLGYVLVRGLLVPKWVGFLLSFGGLGWLTLGFSSLVAPDFARSLLPFILLPGVVGETTLTLRLLISGVKSTT